MGNLAWGGESPLVIPYRPNGKIKRYVQFFQKHPLSSDVSRHKTLSSHKMLSGHTQFSVHKSYLTIMIYLAIIKLSTHEHFLLQSAFFLFESWTWNVSKRQIGSLIEDIMQDPDFWSSWTTRSICERVRCAPVQLCSWAKMEINIVQIWNCAKKEIAIVHCASVLLCKYELVPKNGRAGMKIVSA